MRLNILCLSIYMVMILTERLHIPLASNIKKRITNPSKPPDM
jgi:hypothetical protein